VATEISTQRPVWQELNAVQIRVALDDIEPPVWRRLVVPLGTTLAELHYIIQAAMGWSDSHMHEFEIGGLSYGDIEVLSAERTDDDARVYDANEVRLRDFSRQPGTSFNYV
jgi:Plasmid pRiA4b ORF-3-like protein